MKRILGGLLVFMALLLVAGSVLFLYAEKIFAPEPATYDVGVGAVGLLPPGTVIGEGAPEGWTNLIIKSRPRITSGAVDLLGPTEVRYGTFLFMTDVARVAAKRSTFRTSYTLDAIAVGLGATVNGKDVVLSPETQEALGAKLGIIFRIILQGAYNKQKSAHLVARSPTFAVLDTPALLLRHDHHVDVTLRYALIVDPSTGHLDSLVWMIDRTEPNDVLPCPIEWLPPGKLEDAPLHVDRKEFLFGKPTPRAYAAERIPQGDKHLVIPTELKTLAGQETFTTEEAVQLHEGLRRLMKSNTP
jgi:hypothetical protein